MQNLFSLNKKNPLLSISLLTANRPDTIIKCLDSLTSLRQNVPSELIIVDTGCDQKQILLQYLQEGKSVFNNSYPKDEW